jgi:hypothetical protein
MPAPSVAGRISELGQAYRGDCHDSFAKIAAMGFLTGPPDWTHGRWSESSKSDPIADIRAMRDMLLADVRPHEHVPGCVELDGEYICSPYCRVGKA